MRLTTPGAAREIVGGNGFELLCLNLPWPAIRSKLEEATEREMPHLAPTLHRRVLIDPMLIQTLGRLWDVSADCGVGDTLMADGLVNVLLGGCTPAARQAAAA